MSSRQQDGNARPIPHALTIAGFTAHYIAASMVLYRLA